MSLFIKLLYKFETAGCVSHKRGRVTMSCVVNGLPCAYGRLAFVCPAWQRLAKWCHW